MFPKRFFPQGYFAARYYPPITGEVIESLGPPALIVFKYLGRLGIR